MLNRNIKTALLLCLASLFASPAPAQVSSLTATVSGNTITLNWNSFASTHYVRENGVTFHQTSGTTKTTSRLPGSYQFMVTSCYYDGEPYCIYSNTVYVTVAASIPPATPPPVRSLSIADLQQFLARARGEDKTLANLIGDEIETNLRNANLSLDENGLTYSDTIPLIQIKSTCHQNIQLRNLHMNATLNPASKFDIVMDTLNKPIVASTQLIGTVDADGIVKVRMGFKLFGECIRYLKASANVNGRADFTVNAKMVIKLNPTRVLDAPANEIRIRFNPVVDLEGEVDTVLDADITNIRSVTILGVNLTSGVTGLLAGRLTEELAMYVGQNILNKRLSTAENQANTRFQTFLAEQETSLQNKLRSTVAPEYIIRTDQPLVYDMLSYVTHYALNYFAPADFLQNYGPEILYFLLVGDDKSIRERIATTAACNLTADGLSQNMSRAPLPADFRATSRSEFCGKIDNITWLGNAEPAVSGYSGQDAWTFTPPTSFRLSTVAPTGGNYQPFMKRVHYRTIDGLTDGTRTVIDYNAYGAAMSACYSAGQGYCSNPPNINNYTTYQPIPRGTGSCKLEMRVYKKDVNQTGLKPLLAFHGGAWKYRGASFYGLESQISNFTEQGFVVFAPFYRLVGDADGNVECRKATGAEVVQDAEAALTWVQNNKTYYGVSSVERVRLFGQSAGSHLAGWLVTHRPNDVQKALLMYPPTDAQDYVLNYQAFINGQAYSSNYANSFVGLGVESLEGYFSTTPGASVVLRDVDPYSSLVLNNSYPGMVASSPGAYPPVYMVHGKEDRLVPAVQSVRLCNAYTGNIAGGPANTAGTASRQSYTCGSSRVDLLQEANHALELCLPPLRCEAGASSAAQTAATQSLNDARAWLAQ